MTKRIPKTPPTVLTLGHSTRTLEAFIQLLKAHAVTKIVDVRTVPRSRHNPQFNRETLPDHLKAVHIRYIHMPGLGGLRHPRPDSLNAGWRNVSFRGFADYMGTQEFEENLQRLIQLASKDRIALMCAEALPWRCHRSLIADALRARGILVEHILSSTRRQPHALTPWAQVNGPHLTYPAIETSSPKTSKRLPSTTGKT